MTPKHKNRDVGNLDLPETGCIFLSVKRRKFLMRKQKS